MKLIIGSLILASTVTLASAQQAAQTDEKIFTEAKAAKLIAELSSIRATTAIKNSPLTAEEVNESVQTLADGNRIVHNSTGKIYRNSEGRIRRENSGGVGGVMGSLYTVGQGVSIANPTIGQKYVLDSKLKTAQIVEMNAGQGVVITGTGQNGNFEKGEPSAKLKAELESKLVALKAMPPMGSIAPVAVAGQNIYTTSAPIQGGFIYSTGVSKYDTKVEELGTRDFEGVSAQGTRKVTTIPAGAIGNERPIEIVYERWFSKELGLVVYSKNIDPRFGEQTYKLTNLVRAEPDPSLFALPTGYKVIVEPSSVYNFTGAKATEAERAIVERNAARAATPVVYKTKTLEAQPVTAVEKIKP
ncbi:hypothetical protein BH10ACI2_BH10ACI2_07350 [soil metagenome]